MKFERFLELFQDKSLIYTRDFIASEAVSLVQLSRWVESGKLIKLRRGLYLFDKKYRKQNVDPLFIANNLIWPSYISLEKACEYWGLIPEGVKVYTSITTKRPQKVENDLGQFSYKHVKNSLFWGYQSVLLGQGQQFFIASPEKALLDFFYFLNGEISQKRLESLRIQNLEILNLEKLLKYAEKFKKPKISNSAKELIAFIEDQKLNYKTL